MYIEAGIAFTIAAVTTAAIFIACRKKSPKPQTAAEKDMESIMAFAAYLKDMPENKSYTKAWNYVKKHQAEHPEAPKPRLRRKHGHLSPK